MKVAILFGSRSDLEKMRGAARCLDEFGIPWEAHILSAHRVPERLAETLERLETDGCACIIAGAGLAAHLPGVVASKSLLPVIGVPLDASLGGMDALLSMAQMPKGIPVATVGINNSWNAAMMAVRMLAVGDAGLKERLEEWFRNMKAKFISDNEGEIDL